MQIEYTGRQTEVSEKLRTLAERKLRKLAKTLRGITHVHVILTADKHRQIAEVAMRSPHLTLTATQETSDMAVSVATVIDKVARQAQRHMGKRREGKRKAPARSGARWSVASALGDAGRESRPRVIRTRRSSLKPMTVEEAMLEVESSDDGFLVFRDASTERMNVLFKRKDGNLGLIEPEA